MINKFLLRSHFKTWLFCLSLTFFFYKPAQAQLCTPVINTFPYLESFNATSLPSCWTASAGAGAFYQWAPTASDANFGAAGPRAGSGFLYLYVFLASTSYNTYNLVSPAIALPSVPKQLTYSYFLGSGGYQGTTGATGFDPYPLSLQISLDSGVTWTDIYDHSTSNSIFASSNAVSNWRNNTIDLTAYANQVVMFKFVATSNYGGGTCDQGIDEFGVSDIPACAGGPTSLGISSLSSTSATVTFADATPLPANGYNWIVVASGAGPSATPLASGTVNTGVDSVLITGLTPSTNYDFYIQSNCGGALGVGAWSGPASFLTACSAITSLPWTEGFEGLGASVGTDIFPPCWEGTPTQRWTTASGALGFPASIRARTGTNYIYGRYNANDTLFTPGFALTGGVTYEFYYYYVADGYQGWTSINTMVGQSQMPSGMTNIIGTAITSPTNTTYNKFTAQFTPSTSGTYYFGVNLNSTFSPDDLAFDDFGLRVAPACTGIIDSAHLSGIASTSANINWAAITPAPSNGYNWEIVAQGDSVNGTVLFSGNSSVDSTIISGLTPNTAYDFYVQPYCGTSAGGGDWTGPLSFATPCSVIALPLAEGFNSTSRPSCWTQQYVTGTNNLQYRASSFQPTTAPQEGTDYVFWNSYNIFNGETRLVSPPITSSGVSSVDVSFYWFNENSTFYNSGNYLQEGVKVQYSLDGTTWTDVQFFPRYDNSLPSGTGQWRQKYLTLPLAAANQSLIYVGFSFVSKNGDNCSFDHLNIFPSPPCAGGPSSVIATNVYPTSSTISWTPAPIAPANGYDWVVVASGDSATSPTPIAHGSTLAGVDSVLVSGLTPNTPYDIYVRSNCGSLLGVGYWVGPSSFSTPCSAITSLPWHEGFESLTTTGADRLPACWLPRPPQRWTSTATPITFANISARGGTHYIYDRYFANDTVFTPGFTLTAGTQYEFYFYYLTDGRTGWDSIYAMYGNTNNQSVMTTRIGTPVLSATNTAYQKYSAIFTPTTSGTYYFGVRLSALNFNVNDIGFDDFGLQEVVPCPNPPVTGSITGPSSVCAGATINLNLTGYSPYTVLQWQTSTDSITFTDYVGATQDFLSTNIGSVTYFRVKVLCADSAYTAIFPVYLNSPTLCYCNTTLGGFCGGNNIDTAEIIGTNFFVNYTGCNTLPDGSAYTQFPIAGDSTTSLQRGSTYPIFLHFTGQTISSVWIDYDQSGTFDPSEWVQVTTTTNNGTASLVVPANAALGATGMRIRSRNQFNTNGAPNACTNFGSGETFDFIINIVDSNCNHIPTVLDTITNVSCHGGNNGAFALGISGSNAPYTSHWSTGDTSTAISNLTAGIYADTISFNYGCSYVWKNDSIAQPALLSAGTDSIHSVKCFGGNTGAIFISATGGTSPYSSHWSSGDTTFNLSGKSIGSYSDTITDSHGCKTTLGPDSISQPSSAVTVVIDSTHSARCNGQSNGAIFTTASGGTPGYHFSWSNSGSTTAVLSNLSAGAYAVTVTDSNGCTISAHDTISQPAVLTIGTDSVINAKCHSSTDGSIYVHVTGGTLNYHYNWTGGATTFNLFLKSAGAYTLTVTDANNCTATTTDTITSPSSLAVTSSITNQINNGALGSVGTTVSGGVSPYKYRWNTGDSTSNLSNLSAGVYTVTVIDKNGCTAFQRDTVNLIINAINEVNGDVRNFNVYPNPSSGLFNVLLELNNTVPVQIEIYNITGQLLPNTAKSGSLNNIYQLDLSDQPGGVYLIKLIAGDYTLVRKVTLVK